MLLPPLAAAGFCRMKAPYQPPALTHGQNKEETQLPGIRRIFKSQLHVYRTRVRRQLLLMDRGYLHVKRLRYLTDILAQICFHLPVSVGVFTISRTDKTDILRHIGEGRIEIPFGKPGIAELLRSFHRITAALDSLFSAGSVLN